MHLRWFAVLAIAALAQSWAEAADADVGKLIARIKVVGAEGAGNQDVAVAWKELVARGGEALLPTITALGDAEPRSANWLRTAVDAIAQKEKQADKKLPLDRLEAIVKDSKNKPVSRRLAYELLASDDKNAPERLLPQFLDDPSIDLRRDALAAAIGKATPLIKAEPDKAKKEFERLFPFSRDQDQAEAIAKVLRGFGVQPDLTAHFGFITKWMVVGPFDSTNGAGYQKPFDPEKQVDLSATYKGKDDKPVKWGTYWTFDTFGLVDLNEALGKHKFAAGYAFAALESPEERAVEVRLGSIAATEIFLNGKRVFGREEYHHGQRVDQYSANATLKKGRNELLVKVLQNNQTESWAQEWNFQIRICDATGKPVPLKLLTGN